MRCSSFSAHKSDSYYALAMLTARMPQLLVEDCDMPVLTQKSGGAAV
jgi:hypothetical protein